MRLRGGLLGIYVLIALIGLRLVWMQGFQGSALADEAIGKRTATIALAAPRGDITDRTGEVLAMSVDARLVYVEPRRIAEATCSPKPLSTATDATTAEPTKKPAPCDPAGIAAVLAPALGLPVAEVVDKLSLAPKATGATCDKANLVGCRGYVVLAHGLEPDQATRVRNLSLIGVGVAPEPKRVLPGKDVGANVLGFTTVEGKGNAGIEAQFDDILAGRPGETRAEVDGGGRIIPNGRSTTVEPRPGRQVQLTVERDLQYYAQQVLAAKVQEADALSGSATVMDIKTGEVLALASVPTFDANDPGSVEAGLRENRAILDVYEPGSIGKAITAAAVLEQGALTPDSVLSVPDFIQVSNKRFTDSHSHPVEQLTFTGVLVESSNVGTIMAAQKIGGAKLYEMLQRFGIGAKTGIQLPAESRGLLRDEATEWSKTDYGTHPIGQGYSVNGVQMASVYATIANGGVRMPPTIVKATADDRGELVPATRKAPVRVISPAVSAQLRGMLEGVTNEGGTAVGAAIDGYRVAGKTGTARRNVNGVYDGTYTASFVGFAPADAPRFVVAVSVQAPKNGYYGGTVAAPVFQQVMSFALRHFQVPPTGAASPKLRLRAGE